MNITSTKTDAYVNFCSKNKPIKNFKIDTSKGPLIASEIQDISLYSEDEIHNISKFFIDNFINGSTNPGWKKYLSPKNNDKYENRIKKFEVFLKNLFVKDDGNTTVLLAKNEQGDCKAGIIAFKFDDIKGIEDPKTLYLDSLAVDEPYRRNGIASILMKKVLASSKDVFTDALLTGYNKAIPLYSKLGFTMPDITNPQINAIMNVVKSDRSDIPRYTKLMSKILDVNEKRWWERAFKRISP